MEHTTVPDYSERVTFDNGDHATLAVEDPGYVEVRGHLAGEHIDVSLRADAAEEDGHQLLNGNSPDARWNLASARAARLGHAMIAAATPARLDTPAHQPAPQPPACPDWCDTATEAQHWSKLSDQMPWETIHARRFGELVTVHAGHEVHAGVAEKWPTPTISIDPHHVETVDGPTMLETDDAAVLAGHLHAATAFALALEATRAQPMPAVTL